MLRISKKDIESYFRLRFAQKFYVFLLIALFIIVAEIFILITDTTKSNNPIVKYWLHVASKISCHYFNSNDALPSAEDPDFAPEGKNIFFHETSCSGGLSSRQACAIESAARTHPHLYVYVLFSAPVTEFALNTGCIPKLLEYDNVKLARVHIHQYLNNTPLEPILEKLSESTFPVQHSEDILKMVTLNRWGGIYLDTNMIVLKSLETLPKNWVAKNSYLYLASGAMSFAKDEVGRNVTNAIIKEMSETFDPHKFRANGPRLIQRVLNRMCESILNYNCSGVYIFPETQFYPIVVWDLYFAAGSFENTEGPYTHYMANHMSYTQRIEKDTPFESIAKENCPYVYQMLQDELRQN